MESIVGAARKVGSEIFSHGLPSEALQGEGWAAQRTRRPEQRPLKRVGSTRKLGASTSKRVGGEAVLYLSADYVYC